MSAFVEKRNIITGDTVLVEENEEYDHHQEIARSSFADMLHDTERNRMYEAALKIAIEKTHQKGKKAIVLDIGTGTGLLSMMAVKHGADKVTACEAFEPIAACAAKLIELNGFKNKIKIIPKRSINLVVGENGDLDEKCNILVTEVFDTELIGECALTTFNHANKFLLTEDCIVVPNSATMYAQVVECPIAYKWNRISDFYENGQVLLKVPDNIKNCCGNTSLYDIQLSQLPIDSFKTLMKPTPIFEFNWSSNIPTQRSTVETAKAECDGEAQVVFMWWDLKMDVENKIVLSCAPYWDHPLSKNDINAKIPWRDHWMQAVYFFPKEVRFNKGEELSLLANHDEFSLWFNVGKNSKFVEKDYEINYCRCGFHLLPRSRIGQINDNRRYKVLINTIKNKVVNKDLLVIGNGFYLSLISSKFKARKIYVCDNNSYSQRNMLDFISANGITNFEMFEDLDDLLEQVPKNSIDLVLSEPYFVTSILPWDNFHLYFSLKKIRPLLKKGAEVYPRAVCWKAVAVHFDDLHKIRIPVKECEGFKMTDFDRLIEESSLITDDLVEAQPLWEYPGVALSSVEEILTLDLSADDKEAPTIKGNFKIQSNQACNGIAIWVDWLHGETSYHDVITTGAVEPPEVGKKIEWDRNCRQGVVLFEDKHVDSIEYELKVDLIKGTVKFNCQ